MSHFATAVILKDIKDLESVLAPYQENDGNVPEKYLVFNRSMEDIKHRYETFSRSMYRDEDGELYNSDDKIFEKIIKTEEKNKYTNYHLSKDGNYYTYDYTGYIEVKIPYNVIWSTFEEFLKEYCQDEWDEKAKDYGYWENPNAKWDYWTLCEKGSWARYQNDKIPNGYCKIKDWPLKFDKKEYDEAIRFWKIVIEEQPLKEGEEQPFNMYKKEYYISLYGTKENYATIQAIPHYWAFVLDGQWYEKGRMGMFCMHDATKTSIEFYLEKWNEVINDPQYQDYYIAIVDCHI